MGTYTNIELINDETENDADIKIYTQLSNEANYLKAEVGYTYHRDLGKGIKAFLARIIRRVLRFLLFPMVEYQNDYNNHVANGIDASRIIGEMHKQMLGDTNRQIQRLQLSGRINEKDIQELKKEYEQIHGLQEGLLISIEECQRQLEKLNEQMKVLSESNDRIKRFHQ